MAHEILSVKMYELDKKLEQTHSRIQLAESMDTERLHQQIQNLRQECQESRITLENRLRHSREQRRKSSPQNTPLILQCRQ